MKVQRVLVHLEENIRKEEEKECAHHADRSDFALWALKIKIVVIGRNIMRIYQISVKQKNSSFRQLGKIED